LDQPELDRFQHRADAVAHTELSEDARGVVLHRAFGSPEGAGNFPLENPPASSRRISILAAGERVADRRAPTTVSPGFSRPSSSAREITA
jgi:hypothetical protein